MITQKIRMELGLLGCSKDAIKHATPIEAYSPRRTMLNRI